MQNTVEKILLLLWLLRLQKLFILTPSQIAMSSISDLLKSQVGGIESVLIVQKYHHLI